MNILFQRLCVILSFFTILCQCQHQYKEPNGNSGIRDSGHYIYKGKSRVVRSNSGIPGVSFLQLQHRPLETTRVSDQSQFSPGNQGTPVPQFSTKITFPKDEDAFIDDDLIRINTGSQHVNIPIQTKTEIPRRMIPVIGDSSLFDEKIKQRPPPSKSDGSGIIYPDHPIISNLDDIFKNGSVTVQPNVENQGLKKPIPPSISNQGLKRPAQPNTGNQGLIRPVPPSIENQGLKRPAQPIIGNQGLIRPAPPSIENQGLKRPAQPNIGNQGKIRPAPPNRDNQGLKRPIRPSTGSPLFDITTQPSVKTSGNRRHNLDKHGFNKPTQSKVGVITKASSNTVINTPEDSGLVKSIQNYVNNIQSILNNKSNSVVSPLSLFSLILTLLLASDGKSSMEIINSLRLQNFPEIKIHEHSQKLIENLMKPDNGVELLSSTIYFIQSDIGLSKSFSDELKSYYNASVLKVNFVQNGLRTMDIINDWVYEATRGTITNILSTPPPSNTKIIGINAVYFNAAWALPFDKLLTKNQNFQSPDGNLTIPTMVMTTSLPHYYDSKLNADFIYKCYEKCEFALFFVIPRGNSTPDKLITIEKQLTNDYIEQVINNMKVVEGSIFLPRMKLNFKSSMKSVLQALGVSSIFDPSRSNLNGLTSSSNVFVNDFIHSTVVEVTELGTRAAATTVIDLNKSGINNVFQINKPVITFIRSFKTQMNIFYGKIIKPEPIYI